MKQLLIILLLFSHGVLFGQSKPSLLNFPDTLNKTRLIGVSASASVITLGTMIALNQLWYKNYPRSKFQTFNDWTEWEGMDKVGHGFTSYQIGALGYNSMRWTGLNSNKSLLFGTTWGLIYQTGIEIQDGTSAQWGFSWGDMFANGMGTALFIGQQLIWDDQRIVPKFSFHTTEFPAIRSEITGETFQQQIFKDYNGQTYWLSANLASFLKKKDSKFPKWLSISAGYGATGMIGGHANPRFDADGNPYPVLDRYSQVYFSFDVDLHRIETKSALLKTVLAGLSIFKFPFPAFEFNKHGVEFHPIYF